VQINPTPDILDLAVERIAEDDYNHIPKEVLKERLSLIRGTYTETFLEERVDEFLSIVRQTLRQSGDPDYGPE
jgi:hypothetical protein